MFILAFFSERNYHVALQLRTFQNSIFLSPMQNCFRKYLKISKNIKGSQCNFALENNFGFLEKALGFVKIPLCNAHQNFAKNKIIK